MMQKVFEKKVWKDILIMVILLGVTFLRYSAFRDIKWFKTFYYSIAFVVALYAGIYTLFHCKSNKERKWLVVIYSLSLIFFFRKDMLDVYIYLVLAAIFLENREEFLRTYFISSVIIICISIIFYFFKLIPAYDGVRGELYRYSLGFVHPNTIFRYFFGSLIALYMLDKKKTAFNIYAIGFTIPLYLLTNCRTGLICVMSFVVLANLAIIFEKKFTKLNLKYAFLFVSVFSVIFTVLFNESEWFNITLSNRPKLWYELIVNAKWHLLYGNMNFLYCDNRVIYILIRNGLLALILANLFYYLVFKKETSIELKVVFMVSLIYGLTENFRSLGQTIVPLLCMWSFYDNYMKNKEIKIGKNRQIFTNNDNKEEC